MAQSGFFTHKWLCNVYFNRIFMAEKITLRPIAFNHFYDPSLTTMGGSFIKITRRRGQWAVSYKMNYT